MIRPPGLVTRTISLATSNGFGANMKKPEVSSVMVALPARLAMVRLAMV